MSSTDRMKKLRMNRIALPIAALLLAMGATGFAGCPEFQPGRQAGTIESTQLSEISAIVASRRSPGVFWVHNDSGNRAEIYAIDLHGGLLGVYPLPEGTIVDWEDIALGPGPEAGIDYLYIGDIGDNQGVRASIPVYRVPEPRIGEGQRYNGLSLSQVERLDFFYPDGARDAETLLCDPLSGDLYIITKRESRSRVYRAPFPQSATEATRLEFQGTLPWGWAVGGDVSRSGREVIVRGYLTASIWERDPAKPLWSAFEASPCAAPLLAEQQGEAIAFDAEGRDYLTVSEGLQSPLYYFERNVQAEAASLWVVF
jgi:hypothetical protein